MQGMGERDREWITALEPYLAGGIVPLFTHPNGNVDAVKTIDQFCRLHGVRKIGPNGENLPLGS